MKNIITILDNITETSMPFNEFVLYRANHFNKEHHILIVCCMKCDLPKVNIPSNLDIYYVGKNIFKMRNLLKKIIKICIKNNELFLIHNHQPRAALLSNISMLGTNYRKKEIYTIHSTFSGYSLKNKIVSLFNMLCANRITCVSYASYDAVPSFIKRIKKDRIQALQNGVDTERIDDVLRSNNGFVRNDDVVTFVYIARIIPIKNHDFLLDVISKINVKKKFKFVFIGSLNGADDIIKKCHDYGLNDVVEFTDLIPRNDVFNRISSADVYISSSTLEGMPVSVLEAMYCGLPVILSNIPQHIELANNSDFISILNFLDEEWVSEITKYIFMSKTDRKKIGIECKNYVINNFSLIKMHSSYSKLYDKVLNN